MKIVITRNFAKCCHTHVEPITDINVVSSIVRTGISCIHNQGMNNANLLWKKYMNENRVIRVAYDLIIDPKIRNITLTIKRCHNCTVFNCVSFIGAGVGNVF